MNKKVLVIGDAMIDKHTSGSVVGISAEAPVPVVKSNLERHASLGAAANVAAQIAAVPNTDVLLAHKHFFVGNTDPREQNSWADIISLTHEDEIFTLLEYAEVESFPLFYTGIDGPTTIKERIWTGQQQICRVDYEDARKPSAEIEAVWIRQLKQLIEDRDIDCVVFSDYDKGTLTDRLIQSIADVMKDRLTILDPKRHSYWGLQGLTIIKPNSNEVQITNKSVKELSYELNETLLLTTLSEDGMKLWSNGRHVASERVYATSSEIVDVCGCGDTVTAFLAIGILKGLDIESAMCLASHAAAVNIKHRGCYVLDEHDQATIEAISGVCNGRT